MINVRKLAKTLNGFDRLLAKTTKRFQFHQVHFFKGDEPALCIHHKCFSKCIYQPCPYSSSNIVLSHSRLLNGLMTHTW